MGIIHQLRVGGNRGNELVTLDHLLGVRDTYTDLNKRLNIAIAYHRSKVL